jgi:two-component system cell cycle sensor histidine kinase/response regulator CckA
MNARDAMPDGGKLTIAIKRTKTDDALLRAHPDLTAGRGYAAVSVSDTGQGFDDEAKKHLFEPFFSTKEQTGGSGLGLASVYGVVKGHNGSIEVVSGEGKETTVTLYFPLSEGALEPHLRLQEAAAPEKGEGGTILVVDDEAIILRTVEMVLRKQGYEVVAVQSAAEAVDYYRHNAARIGCVILDIIMPKMNGMICYARLRALNPSVKAIVITGYVEDPAFEEFVAMNCLPVVPKPFDVPVLVEAVRRVLQSS